MPIEQCPNHSLVPLTHDTLTYLPGEHAVRDADLPSGYERRMAGYTDFLLLKWTDSRLASAVDDPVDAWAAPP